MSLEAVKARLPTFPENVREWSLAADQQLCELLKKISNEMISEVTQVSHNVSEVQIETRQLNVLMQNVCNDLCMLANEQFMENLVEDVQGSGNENVGADVVQGSKVDKVVQSIPLITQSLHLGLQVLEKQFEIIDMTRLGSISQNFNENDQDSQTIQSVGDFPANEPIYQPKDPYENRHLPHLIGSVEFIDDDTLGIGYIDDTEELQEKSQELESVASLSSNRKDYLTSSSSDSEEDLPTRSSKVVFEDNVSQHSEDLFEGNSITKIQIDSHQSMPTDLSNKPLSLTDQLNKQLKARLSVSAKPSDNIPDDMEESPHANDGFKNNTKEPTFDVWSDKEEEDMFNTNSNKVSLKGAAVSGISSSNFEIKSKLVKTQSLKEVKPSLTIDDITESEDDMFKPAKSASATKTKEVPVLKPRKISAVLSDTDDDMFKPAKSTSVTKTKEVLNVTKDVVSANKTHPSSSNREDTHKYTKSVIHTDIKAVHTVEESSDSEDMFLPSKSNLYNKKNTVLSKAKPSKKISEIVKDDDDIFNMANEAKSKSETTKSTLTKEEPSSKLTKDLSQTKKSLSLLKPFNFSSDDDDFDDLFKVPSHKGQTLSPHKPSRNETISKVDDVQKNIAGIVKKETSEFRDDNSLAKLEIEEITPNILKDDKVVRKSFSPILGLDDNSISKVKEVQDNIPAILTTKNFSARSFLSKEQPEFENKKDVLKDDKTKNISIDQQQASYLDPLFNNTSSDVTTDALLASRTPQSHTSLSQEVNKDVFVDSTVIIPSKVSAKDFSHDLFSDEEDLFKDSHKKQSNNSGLLDLPREVEADRGQNLDLPSTVPQQHTAIRKSLPGARSTFGGPSQHSSFLKELKNRSRMKTESSDIEEEIKEDTVHSGPRGNGDDPEVEATSKSGWPAMFVTREYSPKDDNEGSVSLETPAKIVNQLTNLTKTRARRRPTMKTEAAASETRTMAETSKEDQEILVKDSVPKLMEDDTDIFANLPLPQKKSKSKKKEHIKSKVSEESKSVDVDEIEDIFAIPNKKTASKKKIKTKQASVTVRDPLGAM